ncbi:MAG: cobalt-precorrin-5B (C(1))-methyltransferase CbiD [Desulfobacteraceae bacterium]
MTKERLKSGFTTGTAAAAAVKGALYRLIRGVAPDRVSIPFLSEGGVEIDIYSCFAKGNETAVCSVIKDAGDDPDITHKAEIGARVTLLKSGNPDRQVVITGGSGVGTVTRPGLEVPVGRPAINPGPVKMIRQAVKETAGPDRYVHVEIFVPEGETLSEKTLNSRLGIVGGISILGTTGIVRPMSHDAYIATIESGVRVACAMDISPLIFSTGRRSERFARAVFPGLPETGFIQVGDFFRASLEIAGKEGAPVVIFAVFFGKAVKMARAVPHTHAAKSGQTLETLAGWSVELTGDAQFGKEIAQANTARHAFGLIMDRYPVIMELVGKKVRAAALDFTGPGTQVHCMILGYDGSVLFDSRKKGASNE